MGWIYRIAVGLTSKPGNPCLDVGSQVWWSHIVTKLNGYLICQLSEWLRGRTSFILR